MGTQKTPVYAGMIFDLEGVVTKTAMVHAAAWTMLFNQYLKERVERGQEPFLPFDWERDYQASVDGKPRYEGVQAFLESRGIRLPFGKPSDPAGSETVCGLGNRKNDYVHQALGQSPVEVFSATVTFIEAARDNGFKTAVVSSSRSCHAILEAAGISNLFDAQVGGDVFDQDGVKGKPAPDIFLKAAQQIGVLPQEVVVVEDSQEGVEAGHRGGFGLVVGVTRPKEVLQSDATRSLVEVPGQAELLTQHGADLVVRDLDELHLHAGMISLVPIPSTELRVGPSLTFTGGPSIEPRTNHVAESHPVSARLPSALEAVEDILRKGAARQVALFLDYDGTVAPIAPRPELAVMSAAMRNSIHTLADHCLVAIVSGRDRHNVQHLVKLKNIFYAGSHGFDIAGPQSQQIRHQEGVRFLPALRKAEQALREGVATVPGAFIEAKKFSVAVHYRLVDEAKVPLVLSAVTDVLENSSVFRKREGEKVLELYPNVDWDKGKAVLWLMKMLSRPRNTFFPIYLGDDVTDEDAFLAIQGTGVGILVGDRGENTAASYSLKDPDEVGRFLSKLTASFELHKL